MARPLVIPILGNTSNLEAALVRSGLVAEDASKKITGSFRTAGLAAAEEAKKIGMGVDAQAAAAGRAAAAFTEMSAKITASQRNAGKAAAAAAAQVGASVDEQRAAYRRAIAAQAEYEATTKATADAVEKSAARQAAAIDSVKSKVLDLGKWAAVGGLGVAAGMVKLGLEFQNAAASIQANSGVTAAAANRITEAFSNMGGKTEFSGQQLEASFAAVSGQLKVTEGHALGAAEAVKVMTASADLAAAQQISLGTATETVSKIMQAYHLKVTDAASASDVLLNVSKSLNVPVDGVATALGRLHARLGDLAPSLKDTSGLMVELGSLGITGTRGIQVVNTAFQTLVGGSKTTAAALQQLGVHVFDQGGKFIGLQNVIGQLRPKLAGLTQEQRLAADKALFGAGAAQILGQVIQGGVPKFQAATNAATKLGTAHQAATVQSRTLRGEFETMKGAVETLGGKFGLVLIPKLTATAHAISNVIDWLHRHSEAAKVVAGVITGVLGAAVTAFAYTKAAAMVGALGRMGTALLAMGSTSEVAAGEVDVALGSTGVGLVLVGVGVAAGLLLTNWKTVMGAMTDAVNTMVQLVEGALNNLIGTLNDAIGLFNSTIGQITGTIGNVGTVNVSPVISGGGGTPPSTGGGRIGGLSGGGSPRGHFVGHTAMQRQTVSSPPVATASSTPAMGAGGGSVAHTMMHRQLARSGGPVAGAARTPVWEQVAEDLARAGFSRVAIAGMLGNFAQETAGGDVGAINTKDSGNGAGGMGGMGLANWTAGRYYAEKSYAARRGLSPTSVAAQVGYLLQELHGGYRNAAGAIQHASSPAAAAHAFDQIFEGGTDPGGVRERAAASAYRMISDGSIGGGSGLHGRTISTLLYSNPLAGDSYSVSRTDQGKDFANIRGTLKAIGAGIITLARPLQGFANTIVEKLTSGPNRGMSIYYGLETGAVPVGLRERQHVAAGQAVARGLGSGSLELGFWDPRRGYPLDNQGYYEGGTTAGGRAFVKFLQQIGQHGIRTSVNTLTGATSGGGTNIGFTLAELAQKFAESVQKAGQTMIQNLESLQQSGSVRALFNALGVRTGGRGPADIGQFSETLTSALATVHGKALTELDHIVGEKHGTALSKIVSALVDLHGKALSRIETKLHATHNKGMEQVAKDLRGGPPHSSLASTLARIIGGLGPTATIDQIEAHTGPANMGQFSETLTRALATVHGKALTELDHIVGEKHGTALSKIVTALIDLHGKALSRIETRLHATHNKGMEQVAKDLRGGPSHFPSLTSVLMKSAAGSQQGKAMEQAYQNLVATGQKQEAATLLAQWKATWATLAQEMYAQQTFKDGELLTMQATQLKDQTTQLGNYQQAQLDVVKAGYTLTNDRAARTAQHTQNVTQTISDEFSGMVQSVEDNTQRLASASNAMVSGINDSTQIRVDTFGERGLYGLNLIAQKLQVGLDVQKASDDQAIAVAQQNLDSVTATQHAAVNTAQLSLDSVTTQQQLLAAAAQNHADQVMVVQSQRLASAQAKVDALTLHEDVSVIGPAQTAVDLGATLPRAQQDVLNAQLKKAQGKADVAESANAPGGAQWLRRIQDSVNALEAAATQGAAAASNTATQLIANANQTVSRVTGAANLAIAQAQGGLTGTQNTAAVLEAELQSGISITSAQAQTQFAGTGTTVNVYGVPAENAAAIGSAVDWIARTQLQVPA